MYGYEMSICRRTLGGIAFGEVSRLVALERVDVDIFFRVDIGWCAWSWYRTRTRTSESFGE